jgi:tRNA G18 (ribose-2'-O)-methylase SpoU
VPVIPLDDPGDARLGDYRDLKDRDLSASGGRFVAEGEIVVRRLLGSRLRVQSILLTAPRLATLAPAITAARVECPVFLATQSVMDAIAGFHVHRGCLAIGERGPDPELTAGARTRTLLVLEDLVSADNVGACVRNGAAFGVDALVLSPRSADPFYRKAIRVALGSTFTVPIVRLRSWPADLVALKRRLDLTLVAAVVEPPGRELETSSGGSANPSSPPTPRPTPPIALPALRRPERVGVLLGSEGPGLSAVARAACDLEVTIPMSPGADSLNVATAGALVLYHLQQVTCR